MPEAGIIVSSPGRGGPFVVIVMEDEDVEALFSTAQVNVNTRVARSGRELDGKNNTLEKVVNSPVAVTVFVGGSKDSVLKSTFGSSTLHPINADPASNLISPVNKKLEFALTLLFTEYEEVIVVSGANASVTTIVTDAVAERLEPGSIICTSKTAVAFAELASALIKRDELSPVVIEEDSIVKGHNEDNSGRNW